MLEEAKVSNMTIRGGVIIEMLWSKICIFDLETVST